MKNLKLIPIIVLGLFVLTACQRNFSRTNDNMVEHTFHRLSFQYPSNFTITERNFLQLLTPTLVVLFTHNYATGPRDVLADELRLTFFGQGYEQISPNVGLYTLVNMDHRVWGRMVMESPNVPYQQHIIYFFASGGEHYVIRFVVAERNLEDMMPIIESILNSVAYDDSHHRAEISGSWIGFSDSSLMVFDDNTFYWFLEETKCRDNVKIGEFHMSKGVLMGGTYYSNAFIIMIHYTNAFRNGERIVFSERSQRLIFLPSDDVEWMPELENDAFVVIDASNDAMFLFERVE